MRLTNNLRRAFVRAVLDDIPVPDNILSLDDIRTAVRNDLERDVPLSVKTMMNDDTQSLYLNLQTTSLRDFDWMTVHYVGERQVAKTYSAELTALLAEQKSLRATFDEQRDAVESKLTAVAMGCSTLKQLQAQLPDLIKYMPSEEAPVVNVPAIADVAADLRRMGVPC